MSVLGRGSRWDTLWRVFLWSASLIVAVSGFSLLLDLLLNRTASIAPTLVFFHITLRFAFPVWCLYLPLIIVFKDAEEQRGRLLLISGGLIGPISIILWSSILQLTGKNLNVWQSDPLAGVGGITGAICALFVGLATTSLYVTALRYFAHRSVPGSALP